MNLNLPSFLHARWKKLQHVLWQLDLQKNVLPQFDHIFSPILSTRIFSPQNKGQCSNWFSFVLKINITVIYSFLEISRAFSNHT